MSSFLSVLIVIVCLLLCIVVLVQNSKGGGLSSAFASSNQVMGVKKTADFLEKATWSLAIALLVLSLLSTQPPSESDGPVESQTKAKASQMPTAPTMPAAPTAQPFQQPSAPGGN